MRHFSRRVGAILVSVFCASGAIAADLAECTDCMLEEEDRPQWLLSVTFDDPDTRFGIAVGFTELATPLERALIDAGIDLDESWTIALRFEVSL